jgi:hypothetical protein
MAAKSSWLSRNRANYQGKTITNCRTQRHAMSRTQVAPKIDQKLDVTVMVSVRARTLVLAFIFHHRRCKALRFDEDHQLAYIAIGLCTSKAGSGRLGTTYV